RSVAAVEDGIRDDRPWLGLIAAPLTPFYPDGSVHLDAIDRLAEHLVACGVAGAFVCGTTGEGLSLTTAERQAVAERWVRAARGRLRVIVHVGHTALGEAQALARHAQEIGAAALAALAPCFFRPPSVAALVDVCAAIARAAPRLPFYYYHIPAMTGVGLPAYDFLQAAAGRIPTLAGVKFSADDLVDFERCAGLAGGRFEMLYGRDEMLLAALAVGARGAVGSTYQFAAPLYGRLLAAWRAGDLPKARAEQRWSAEIVAVLARYGVLAAQKAVMQMIGIDCGPVRPPLVPLDAGAARRLRSELEAIGFYAAIEARPAAADADRPTREEGAGRPQ
ncbi:MAG TPA: dihydrodipicolinate synthase family protein, partial [Limnochordia bacterium]